MIRWLLPLLAFSAAALLVLASARWLESLLLRHPKARRLFLERRGAAPLLSRAWDLVIHILMMEFAQTFAQRRQGIELALRRAGEPLEENADRFLARSIAEGCAVTMTSWLLFTATIGSHGIFLPLGMGLLHTFGIRPHRLRARAGARTQEISRRLPYAIDLAVLVLSAGGTPREGLERIGQQEDNPLGEEFRLALAEMDSGAPQHRALSAMANRLQLEDLESLVVAINRGEATGAPMARALETQAEIFRFRRLQRAERLAVEAPVKMMFPNLLIMLSVLLLVLGPVLVKLARDGLL